jgi:glycosyltransferase involved in cell wall biosynthesis/peptidoglycan/xylan/chitin deacetylase (PgdA/CDA1 family)
MLKVIFTLDYEIHGNGEGSPYELMIEPTARMLRLFDEYGAKLTIMADIGEILRFKDYAERNPSDDFHYAEIVAQLQDAIRRGHDVQLHIHSSYFNATFDGRSWVQDWSEYNFAGLNLDRMRQLVKQGKEFLESILRPVDPNYRCVAFRAANWSVSPATNVAKALLDNDITIDTSVFKYGRRDGLVMFDYSTAYSDVLPWPASEKDLCVKDDQSRLWEFPIYCENRWIGAFLTANRIYRAAQGRNHRIAAPPATGQPSEKSGSSPKRSLASKLTVLTKRHAWKADFNQCTGRQLVGALERAERKTQGVSNDVPFVLIGHSKIFSRWNEKSLRPFLQSVAENPKRFSFGVFEPPINKYDVDGNQRMKAASSDATASTLNARPCGKQSDELAGLSAIAATLPEISRFVIITPAHNEQNLISQTIDSVLRQTVKPARWVIVDDRSTDKTREIAERYVAQHEFISVISVPKSEGRTFGRKAVAFNLGVKELAGFDYDFIGNIDADMTLPPDYFQRILEEFAADPKLGLSGGAVCTMHKGHYVDQDNALNSVGGALQLFRRECFDAIGGGYLPLEYGGIDTAAEIFSRMKGWKVRKVPSVKTYEGRATGTADRSPLKASFRKGERFHSLGYGLGLQFIRSLYRIADRPFVICSFVEFAGYVSAAMRRRPVVLSPQAVQSWRNERWNTLAEKFFSRLPVLRNILGRARHVSPIEVAEHSKPLA